MTRFLSSTLLARLCAVLLAVIALQAAAPGAAMERSHGSAFSAATYEVALAGRTETATARLAPLPVPQPALPPPLLTAIPVRAALPVAPLRAHPATGPPLVQVAVRLPEPRAPPLS